MKPPKNFLPDKSLIKKISQALQKKKKGKDTLLLETHKRKIIIDTVAPKTLEGNIIYVHCNLAESFANQGFDYHLNIVSNQDFYFPVSDNPIDWWSRKRKEGVAPLRTEERLLHYIKLLEENNKAVIVWQNNAYISDLKEKFKDEFDIQ